MHRAEQDILLRFFEVFRRKVEKREEYRKVFDGFDPYMIRNYNEDKIESLMTNKGIVRNRRKIQSVISNAVAFIKVAEEFGTFSKFLWAYVDHTPIQNNHTSIDKVPAITELSITISGDLKRRGFKFVGPTIIYAMMQAIGMVNDHTTYCFRHNELKTRNDKKK